VSNTSGDHSSSPSKPPVLDAVVGGSEDHCDFDYPNDNCRTLAIPARLPKTTAPRPKTKNHVLRTTRRNLEIDNGYYRRPFSPDDAACAIESAKIPFASLSIQKTGRRRNLLGRHDRKVYRRCHRRRYRLGNRSRSDLQSLQRQHPIRGFRGRRRMVARRIAHIRLPRSAPAYGYRCYANPLNPSRADQSFFRRYLPDLQKQKMTPIFQQPKLHCRSSTHPHR